MKCYQLVIKSLRLKCAEQDTTNTPVCTRWDYKNTLHLTARRINCPIANNFMLLLSYKDISHVKESDIFSGTGRSSQAVSCSAE